MFLISHAHWIYHKIYQNMDPNFHHTNINCSLSFILHLWWSINVLKWRGRRKRKVIKDIRKIKIFEIQLFLCIVIRHQISVFLRRIFLATRISRDHSWSKIELSPSNIKSTQEGESQGRCYFEFEAHLGCQLNFPCYFLWVISPFLVPLITSLSKRSENRTSSKILHGFYGQTLCELNCNSMTRSMSLDCPYPLLVK